VSERRYIVGCDAVHPDRRGGQHVAMACPGVLVIDDEAGIGVLVQHERSQVKNKNLAETLLDWAIELTKEHGK
jgi:protein subunit release factor A